jgi:predicted dehydrogenase
VPPVRIAVVGAGSFGRNHLRVLRQLPGAELVGVVDTNADRAQAAASEFGCAILDDLGQLETHAEAAVVATPTTTHADIGCALLTSGIDVLIEKPIAQDVASARRLIDAAAAHGRILQVGHLERFNPAVEALRKIITVPLFFEIHRMSVFTPRSLDIDVLLDLMIHDIEIVLDLVGQRPSEIRAAGLPILSDKVDIANVRLAFETGCVANLTASRVSTERIRKLRLFQPSQYISLDYQRQEAITFTVSPAREVTPAILPVEKNEPLRRELESFLSAVTTRQPPVVTGEQGLLALEVCLDILAKIEEHTRQISQRLHAVR